MGAVHRRGCLTLQAADEPLRWASGRPRGEGRGPVAPPVFKTGLSLLVGDGRFDSFPSPPNLRFFLSADGRNYLQLLNWRISERWLLRTRCSDEAPREYLPSCAAPRYSPSK